MIILKLDLFDGKGPVDVVVGDYSDADRLNKFAHDAGDAFVDQERWVKVKRLMTHEHNGPNAGWTLGMVIPGDDPDDAIDELPVDPLVWSKAAGVEEF